MRPLTKKWFLMVDAKRAPSYSSDLHFLSIINLSGIKHLRQPFFLGIDHCLPFFMFKSFFEHIFKHINTPLSDLSWKFDKFSPED